MASLIHFIFELIKISILTLIYSYFLLLLIKKLQPSLTSKFLNRLNIRTGIFILLFIWQFTYWGNHGLGDSSRIPLGFGKEIKQIDASSYIEPKKNHTIGIQSFSVLDNQFYGLTSEEMLITWNLETNTVTSYQSKEDYIETEKTAIPSGKQFSTFWGAYKNHWNGWRFWLLP
jgi:hypothetical protein